MGNYYILYVMGRYASGQSEQTVNLSSSDFASSNLALPTIENNKGVEGWGKI